MKIDAERLNRDFVYLAEERDIDLIILNDKDLAAIHTTLCSELLLKNPMRYIIEK